ncbi:phosphoribosylformylglycinamidine synthase subunit PurS [Candidatus Sumerlaeota bacterium]|nr:phosphoribosylformylglycinamidine synthase subunit PurS [Candidatus Sumerlaeota bacterium]
MIFRARIHVMLKRDVADVQGIAIQQSLSRHGSPVREVKAGKYFEIELDCADEAIARAKVEELANGTFANPVIERYWFDLIADH